ncbi:hypothetical protein V5O48_012210 [Marasmius crinis-equi]|uniref:NmrA-like domain-containing protein n=1 Tax=Marasmius crinis-equi TaxID=585013 RepID=A0ABR3F401_9AGAR
MSSRSKTIVLVTGATGYIGGSVLSRLLNLPDAQSKYEFRAVVRDVEKAKKLADEFGVKPIIGSHSDEELISREAAEADIIVAMSGTGVLTDKALGEYTSDVIWDDENVAQIESLAPDAPQRPVELKVVSADEEGYAYTYIVCLSVIYDGASNPLVDAGIANSRTIAFKMFVPISIKRGYGTTIGKGENVWANVHIDEVTDFYVLLFKNVLKDSNDVPHGKEGYFFIGADEHKSKQWYSEVAKVLFDLGKVKSPEPTLFTEQEAKQYFGEQGTYLLDVFGGNARSVSNRARKLGWQPRRTTNDFIGSIRAEVEFWADSL